MLRTENASGLGRKLMLVGVGILMGSILVSPGVAHVTKNANHLWKKHIRPKADNRYINHDEKASDSELLDGLDSTDFLGAGDTAANSNALGGRTASQFMSSTVYKLESPVTAGTALGDGTHVISHSCNAGDLLLSGGPANVNATSTLLESFPSPGTNIGWSARINKNAQADNFSVVILCIDQ